MSDRYGIKELLSSDSREIIKMIFNGRCVSHVDVASLYPYYKPKLEKRVVIKYPHLMPIKNKFLERMWLNGSKN